MIFSPKQVRNGEPECCISAVLEAGFDFGPIYIYMAIYIYIYVVGPTQRSLQNSRSAFLHSQPFLSFTMQSTQ